MPFYNLPDQVREWVYTNPASTEEFEHLPALSVELTRFIKGVGFFFLNSGWHWNFMPAPVALTEDEVSNYLDNQLDGQRRLYTRKVPKRIGEFLNASIIQGQ